MTLDPAPLRVRLAAGTLDGALAAALFGLGGLAVMGNWSTEQLERASIRARDPRVERGLMVLAPLLALAWHWTRGPGWRIVGIRQVDTRSGGPESLRSAVIRVALTAALQQAIHRVNAPNRERMNARRVERTYVGRRCTSACATSPRRSSRRRPRSPGKAIVTA